MHLYEVLALKVDDWRQRKYPHSKFPAIAEILEWSRSPDVSSFQLRQPQLRALETYWYLRLVEGTPHILDLYSRCFSRTTERLAALGMEHPDLHDMVIDIGIDGLVEKVRNEDAFVKRYRLEAVRETLTLEYPSYILALAMGSGKTVLIGAIFATEFAMAQEYPDSRFIENAQSVARNNSGLANSVYSFKPVKYLVEFYTLLASPLNSTVIQVASQTSASKG